MNADKQNSLWLALQFSSTIIVSLITLKLNLSHYGEELYGVWILISSLWGFSNVLDFGMGTTIIRFVARLKDHDENKIDVILSSTFFVFIVLGCVIFVLMYGIAEIFYFSNNNLVPQKFQSPIRLTFLILGIGFYSRYISLFFKAFIEGMNNFVLSSKILISGNLVLLAGVIIVTIYNLSIVFLALIYLIFPITLLVTFLLFFIKKYDKYSIKIKNFSLQETKQVFLFSINIQGMSIFGALIDPVIKYILGNFYALNTVSFYEIARRFASAISGLFNTTFRLILPKASKLRSIKDYKNFILEDCVHLSQLGATYSVVVFGVGSIILAAMIKIWFHFDEAVILFLILALPESLNNFGYSLYNFLIGIGKASILMKIQALNLFTVSLFLVTGHFLLGARLGLLGYFIAILIAISIMLFSVQKYINEPIKFFLKKSKFKKLLIFDIILLVTILSLNYEFLNTFLALGLLSVSSFLIYFEEILKHSRQLKMYVWG